MPATISFVYTDRDDLEAADGERLLEALRETDPFEGAYQPLEATVAETVVTISFGATRFTLDDLKAAEVVATDTLGRPHLVDVRLA